MLTHFPALRPTGILLGPVIVPLDHALRHCPWPCRTTGGVTPLTPMQVARSLWVGLRAPSTRWPIGPHTTQHPAGGHWKCNVAAQQGHSQWVLIHSDVQTPFTMARPALTCPGFPMETKNGCEAKTPCEKVTFKAGIVNHSPGCHHSRGWWVPKIWNWVIPSPGVNRLGGQEISEHDLCIPVTWSCTCPTYFENALACANAI